MQNLTDMPIIILGRNVMWYTYTYVEQPHTLLGEIYSWDEFKGMNKEVNIVIAII